MFPTTAASEPGPSGYEKLFEVAVEQYGYITTGDARDLGPGAGHLVDLARRGDLDRIAHGFVYQRDLDPADVTRAEGIPVETVRRTILDGIDASLVVT